MKLSEKQKFTDLLSGVYALYRLNLSDPVVEIWWRACMGYELHDVAEAFSQHCVNPDCGQYIPKPADVVRALGGTTKDAALIAWVKVSDAVRSCGSWSSLVFDDPIIHRVIDEMGGWVWLCSQTIDQWPFVERRFLDHYRAYRVRAAVPEYPRVLLGQIDLTNSPKGVALSEPVFIGERAMCERVQSGHANRRALPAPA